MSLLAAPPPALLPQPGLYTPKLVTALREGYGREALRADIMAGLTVAVVALPLSMAIAIASGVGPERGLYTAIVGGFTVSALGGSRFQIGGPAGAFIVLVLATVQAHGLQGLLLATMLSGIMMMLAGALRLGTFVKFMPYPVTVGFTAGIGVIIAASQIKDFLGMKLAGAEPGAILPKLALLAGAWRSITPAAVLLSLGTVTAVMLLRRYRPRWPGLLLAVVAASLVAALLGLPVDTIGTRFGEIPRTLPAPALPVISPGQVLTLLPNAFGFALLGSIESLLSAVVADSMSGRRHRSNCELVAQGVANIASSLFGGFCVTGAVARTAANVRSGARSPVSGMLHAVFLLLFMLLAAPLASFIPLAALAGVLMTVCWGMIERHAIAASWRSSRGDALVLAVTFLLTVFRDLTEGIVAGFAVAALIFMHRMAQAAVVTPVPAGVDIPDSEGLPGGYTADVISDPDIAVYRLSGAFFFGAAAGVASALERIGSRPKAYVLDFSAVPLVDATAAAALAAFVREATGHGARVVAAAAAPAVVKAIAAHDAAGLLAQAPDLAAAVQLARAS